MKTQMGRLIALALSALVTLTAVAVQGQSATPASPESNPNQAQASTPLAPTANGPSIIKLTEVAKGFSRPSFVTGAGDGSGRLFVVEQTGLIRIIQDGSVLPTPFLDVSDLIHREALQGGYSERGLLGLAFDPKFAENRSFYVDYTALDGTITIVRYKVSAADPNVADPASAEILFTQPHPDGSHNGGMIGFSPKNGYLYISIGDGGPSTGGDPNNNGQNKGSVLGKILRIDVSEAGATYHIPPDNPESRDPSFAPEVWDYGLRNPWRFSFDAETGDLWIADVGQYDWEEVNFEAADSPGGNNYGWKIMEASHRYSNTSPAPGETLIPPVFEFSHAEGISITGGYVYRGSAIPALTGVYLFSDWGLGTIWGTRRNADGTFTTEVLMPSQTLSVSSFGEGDDRELYVVEYGGSIFRIDPA